MVLFLLYNISNRRSHMKKLLLMVLPFLLLTACNNQTNQESIPSTSIEEHIEVEETQEYTKEDLTFRRDNLKIAGELYIPSNSYDVFPLIILSHGFGGNMSSTRNDAITFTKAGYASFIFDFIGGGSSIKSDGKMTEMSVLTEAEDLNTVIDNLLEDERIDGNHIFLLGQSQGGFVSTYVASTRDDIKGLLAFYPAYVLQDDAYKQYSKLEDVPEVYTSPLGVQVGRIYWEDATSFDIYEVMQDYENPALIIHGTNDNIVPLSYAQRAAETMLNAEILVLQGAGHGFSGQDNVTAINASLELMNENL